MGYKVTTVRLPDEAMNEIEDLVNNLSKEKSEILREVIRIGIVEVKLRYGIEEYQKGAISLGRLSEYTGLGYRETQLELKKRGIIQKYNEDDLMILEE
jgi:predicted HTH domain antitoxin